MFIALKIWHELPAATRKYIAEVEDKAEIELVPGMTTLGSHP